MSASDSNQTEDLFDEIKLAVRMNSTGDTKDPADSPDNYELLEEIHRGGQGVVFKAMQRSTNRLVAIKFVRHGAFATAREQFRFEREIDLASQLNHPNIVTVFDGGVANGQHFCVMEFVDGRPLNQCDQPDSRGQTQAVVELLKRFVVRWAMRIRAE